MLATPDAHTHRLTARPLRACLIPCHQVVTPLRPVRTCKSAVSRVDGGSRAGRAQATLTEWWLLCDWRGCRFHFIYIMRKKGSGAVTGPGASLIIEESARVAAGLEAEAAPLAIKDGVVDKAAATETAGAGTADKSGSSNGGAVTTPAGGDTDGTDDAVAVDAGADQ